MLTTHAPLLQASKKLYEVLRQFSGEQVTAFYELLNNKEVNKIGKITAAMSETRQAREIVAGSIIQIAHALIRDNSDFIEKPPGLVNFESQMNRMLEESGSKKAGKFKFPDEFCVGRMIGDLPVGVIVYAARNHFCHYNDESLRPTSGVVFDYLRIHFEPQNGLSLNHGEDGSLCCYAVMAILGWSDDYEKFLDDMRQIAQV